MSIQNIDLQRLFPAPVYKRGLDYYRKNRVSEPVFDRNNNVWTANVQGTESYFVEIDMRQFAEGSIRTSCNCPAFETYQTCKHVVATLIAISKKPDSRLSDQMTANYQTTDQLINSIASLQQSDHSTTIAKKQAVQIEYYLKRTYDNLLVLEMKAGVSRTLVVKNVFDFLKDVRNGNDHYFTKTFTYSPDSHYFTEADRTIFAILYDILRNEQVYADRVLYHYQDRSERSVLIPPMQIEALLEHLVERNLTVEMKRQSMNDVSIVKGDLPFHFAISQNDRGEMVLTMEEMNEVTYFPDYHMLFSERVFYFPKQEQIPVLDQLSNVGLENQELPVSKNQSDAFVSEVLPTLKKVGDVQIAEDVASDIIQVPLQAKLYLDVQEEWIVGQLEYHYGDHVIDPFNGRDQTDVIIIRDVDSEQQIMRRIEHANFHYNGKELYIEAAEETLYEFLYYELPLLEEYVELYLTSSLRQFIVENQPSPSTSIQLESSSNLLEVGFTIEGINDDEVNQVLNAVIEKKRYYRMESGALLSLEGEEFSSISHFFNDLGIESKDIQNGNVELPVYRGTQVDELVHTKKDYDPSFKRLLSQLQSPEQQDFPLPDQLNATLRDYQKTGYQWFKSLSMYQLGGILADDMGLGKTLQSIAYMVSEPREKPHLIVAPSSVVYNWKNECQKFAPDLKTVIMTGTPGERQERFDEMGDQDVWITSYATLRQDIERYRDLNFQSLILDEAQYIKNYQTKTSQAIREVKAAKRFALSGTPIENSIDELWAIFQVILPGLMPDQRSFRQLSHEKINTLTKPFILRRIKQDVLQELPDKIETVHVSELTKEQKELYIGYLRQVQQEAAQSMQDNDFGQNRMKILAGLTRLRQICCHPALFVENYEGQSGKLEQLMETVRNAVGNGKRMLIFSQFTQMHEIIMKNLDRVGIDYFYLHGGTHSQDRVNMSEQFNAGEKSVFLISLKAGGTGLNLTGADTVILYDLWWNPAVEDQATDRAHRIGQKNVVQVIRLITEGTIEEKIYDLQQKKRELIDQVIQPGDNMLSSISEDDIKELLNL